MEETGASLSCLFCDTQISSLNYTHSVSLNAVNQFIHQLEIKSHHDLSSISDAPPLCQECYSEVGKAVEWREQVGEVERDVRSLQRIILKMMRQLTSLQSNYLGEMGKLEGKIRASQDNLAAKSRVGKVAGEGSEWSNQQVGVLRQAVINATTAPCAPEADLPSPVPKTEPDSPPPEEDTVSLPESWDDAPPPPKRRQRPSKSKKKGRPTLPTTPQCHYCGKTLPDAYQLKHHLYTHTKERPYLCDLCPKSYAKRNDLTRHRLIHSGQKRWQCPDCPKAFVRRDHLEEHRRTHTGEKPYLCQFCGRGFSLRGCVRKHVKKMHPNETEQPT